MTAFSSPDRSDERRTGHAGLGRILLVLLLGLALMAALNIQPGGARAADALLPYGSPDFRYSIQPHDGLPGFEQPGYDDSAFNVGPMAFGTAWRHSTVRSGTPFRRAISM